ncbi:MAG: hypothetical protein M9887_06585 [Chitinophagales bacterium]|nr:hypothetical protein [Chitinophagales bacterium]
MKKFRLSIILTIVLKLSINLTYAVDLYVDASISTSGNGLSWTTAFKTLTEAINLANQTGTYNNIYVAKGTYYPTGQQNGTDRDATFFINICDLKLLGGYPNGGGVRNIKDNPTILSGDIGALGNMNDNSYHIMVIPCNAFNENSVVVDGFIFQYGNANGSGSNKFGINGLSVQRNRAGAIAIWDNYSANGGVNIRNCISNNRF